MLIGRVGTGTLRLNWFQCGTNTELGELNSFFWPLLPEIDKAAFLTVGTPLNYRGLIICKLGKIFNTHFP